MISRALIQLALVALFAFSAGGLALSLPALDDCFYARKAVEMARSGGFFAVTWNGAPAFQNPPLQIWILARSLSIFGENDLAARLPSILMGVGILVVTFHLGRRLFGEREAGVAVAWLAITPLFVNNARRVMMEIPLAFWVTLAVLVFVSGLDRPRRHALLALPLGAALLTKSVLGLLPLVILLPAALLCPALRDSLRRPWLWLGILGGLALFATWPLHQAATIGRHAVRAHFVGEILSRSAGSSGLVEMLAAYPVILLKSFQPIVLPGAAGVVLLAARWRRSRDDRASLVAVWAVVPVILYSLSSARADRYIFPILPALALAAAVATVRYAARFGDALARYLAPGLLAAAGVVFWVRPALLSADSTRPFKDAAPAVRASVPAGEPIPYAGGRYWRAVNPVFYYAERQLTPPMPLSLVVANSCAGHHLLAIDSERAGELQVLPVSPQAVASSRDVTIFRLSGC